MAVAHCYCGQRHVHLICATRLCIFRFGAVHSRKCDPGGRSEVGLKLAKAALLSQSLCSSMHQLFVVSKRLAGGVVFRLGPLAVSAY